MTLSQGTLHLCIPVPENSGPLQPHWNVPLSPTGMSHEGKAPDVPLLGYPTCLGLMNWASQSCSPMTEESVGHLIWHLSSAFD